MNAEIIKHCEHLQLSWELLSGKKIINNPLRGYDLFHAIYHAPFVIVSHNTDADPVFNFANLKAQELWEMGWEEFTQLPSRLSAEPISREERETLLQAARKKGYIDTYRGIRISKTGKRFYIIDAIIWNVSDEKNKYLGQAAMFSKWEWIE